MSSRIEQIIEEIEEYVESCKYQPLSTTKIVVNKEELEELLRELRLKTPDEIKRYQKIIEDTKRQVQEMVKESEVMQQAYAQANETINSANQQAQAIIDSATNDANSLRLSAVSYTDEMMANMGQIVGNILEDAAGKYNEFVRALQASADVIRQNRAELAPQLSGAAAQSEAAQAPVQDLQSDDLDSDLDDFDDDEE